MNAIKAIFKKELLQLWYDKRLVAFLFFMPLLLLVLFGYALKLEPENVKMAYVDKDHSFFSNLIKTSLWSDGYFQLYEVEDKNDIIEEIRSGRAKAGLLIEKDFSKLLTDNAQPEIDFFVDGTMPSLTTAMKNRSSAMNDDDVTNGMYFLDEDSENVIIAPEPFIKTTQVLFNPDSKETWFFLPGVIGVLLMQVALILAGTAIVREKEKFTLEQIIVSPVTKSQFIIGKMTPYLLISFFEFYFILTIGWLIFDIPLPSSAHLYLFLLSLVYVGSMISLGLLISMISQTQQQAMFLAIFIIIPSILLSGLIFPIEAMSDFIKPIAYLLPFTYFVEIIRGVLIKETLFADLALDYAALFGFTIVFIILSITQFKKYLS
jgi:ABC-2 type transport system permease protein